MKILVSGGFNEDKPELLEKTKDFTKILGKEIISQGHTLINACITQFDAVIAESALEALQKEEDSSINRVIGYIIDGKTSSHSFGKIINSELKDWELGGPSLRIPEPIENSDVIIIVSGFDGAQRAANWARIANKPILPIGEFEGAGKLIYSEERNNFLNSNVKNISLEEFEDLAQKNISNEERAQSVLNLAERVNISKNVFAIMSFTDDPGLEDAYESFKEVCLKFNPSYNCLRMDEITDIKRITPEMLNGIKNSAFVIVDLTLERPNVYYELGYADALDKSIIVTAKAGTNIHFDAKDFPIIFWESQTKLKKELTIRINQIAVKQGRKLS